MLYSLLVAKYAVISAESINTRKTIARLNNSSCGFCPMEIPNVFLIGVAMVRLIRIAMRNDKVPTLAKSMKNCSMNSFLPDPICHS